MAIKDDKTPRLGLLLPFTDNFLQDDVERLRETLNLLDVLVVVRDKDTGKIADDELSAVIARLDNNGKLVKTQIPDSVVQKGADGKIDASLMPSIAVVDTFPVPNEPAMLGLTCERGDIAIRQDLGKTFILTQMPPSTLSNWRELTSTNVTSVNGKTGAVTGLAGAGANNDITSLNALSGPLRLGGDGAGDYDAVTMRQLRASSGGAGGASMNGVMNNFIGAVEWFNGSRARLPAGYIPADGQEVSQTDPATADLYAAVNAGLYITVSEAAWQDSGTAGLRGGNRGAYVKESSAGKFRVPDLNGARPDGLTPGANFLRGDAGGMLSGEIGGVGAVNYNAAPNITGFMPGVIVSSYETAAKGAFSGSGSQDAITKQGLLASINVEAGTTGYTASGYGYQFNAYNSNQAYGRGSEVRPNSVTGIWIIRASGTFQAQNTSFAVLNGDTAQPAAGTLVKGGQVATQYQVGGITRSFATLQSQQLWGTAYNSAMLSVGVNGANGLTTQNSVFEFRSNGDMISPFGVYGRTLRADVKTPAIRNTVGGSVQSRVVNSQDGFERAAFGLFVGVADNDSESRQGNLSLTSDGSVNQTWIFDLGGGFYSPGPIRLNGTITTATVGGTVSLASGIYPTYMEISVRGVNGLADGARAITHQVSDARKKTKVETIPAGQAMALMDSVRPVSFAFKANALLDNQPELPRSYGLIAQEIEALIPDAVITLSDGMKELEPSVMNGFLFATVKDLVSEVKDLREKIVQLTG